MQLQLTQFTWLSAYMALIYIFHVQRKSFCDKNCLSGMLEAG